MGHVPPGQVSAAGASADLPGRQHRRGRARRTFLKGPELARLGERLAAGFLVVRGGEVVARNARSGRGEVDLLVRFAGELAAIEVKTRTEGDTDPAESFTPEKAAQVRRVAAALGAQRVDLVTVTVGAEGAAIRWVPRAW